MSWPLSQDYNEAIQSPASNFADADLKHGEAVVNALGLPMPYSGNFADVYQVRGRDGSRWAVKCFTREARGLRERYQEIGRHLRRVKLPFTVDFTYLEQGIRVVGKWYPVLKMEWVEGFTLNQFVGKYADSPTMLETLLRRWGRMAKYLRQAEVGHCDLQHGNILLAPGASANSLALKLIDYDGMWVPALAGTKSGEVGHPCYQHPQRLREQSYSLDVDRFPLLLIATALRALRVKGKPLWDRHDNGDNLLFREADLLAPMKSHLFLDLTKTGDALVSQMMDLLVKALRGSLETVPRLEEVMPETLADSSASHRALRPATPPPAATAVSAVPVVVPPVAAKTCAFDESDPAAPSASSSRLKRTKMKAGGAPVWAWVVGAVGGTAVAAVILGGVAAALLAMNGSAPAPTPTSSITARRDKEKDAPPPKDGPSDNPRVQAPSSELPPMAPEARPVSNDRPSSDPRVKAPPSELLPMAPEARPVSLEYFGHPGLFVGHANYLGCLTQANTAGNCINATFEIVPGLAKSDFVSFRSFNYPNYYLVHGDFRIRLQKREDSDVYRQNGTFKQVSGLALASGVSFESVNYPGFYIHVRDDQLFLDKYDGSALFRIEATFTIREPRFDPAAQPPSPPPDAPPAKPQPPTPTPLDADWLKAVAALPPDEQVKAVAKELQRRNPNFDGKVQPTVESGVVTKLVFFTDNVTDVASVKALAGLREFVCRGSANGKGKLADLGPLKGMKLTALACDNTNVTDLSSLQGMPLTTLDCDHTMVSDLSPLAGMPLTTLDCSWTKVSKLSPLKGMALVYINCMNTAVDDLSPLQGMPLTVLNCNDTPVSDLSPLKGTSLTVLTCDFKAERDAEVLRSIRTLKQINGKPAKDFWNDGNAKQQEKKPDAKQPKIIKTPSGLQYVELQVGTGKEAKPGDTVTVNYVGTLKDGTKFDSSVDRNLPFTFQIGKPRGLEGITGPAMLFRCWDEAVTGMKEGGKRELTIPPDLGFGAAHTTVNGLVIPPNSELHLEVELVKTK